MKRIIITTFAAFAGSAALAHPGAHLHASDTNFIGVWIALAVIAAALIVRAR